MTTSTAARRKPRPVHDGPKRAAIYVRVSTEDQAEDDKTSLDDQERACREYIEYRSRTDQCELVGVWREDGTEGSSSGKTFDRPRWRDLEAACRRGDVDLIVIAKHDRFSRKAHLAGAKEEELRNLQVGLALLNMQVDTSSPNGRFMFNMLMAGAEWERDTILERMSVGQYGAARNGRWPSSSRATPFGYRKVGSRGESRLEVDPDEAATIREAARLLVDERLELVRVCEILNAREMLPRGRSLRGGGNTIGRWYAELLRRVMSEEARYGLVVWGKTERSATGKYGSRTVIPGIEPVITKDRWDQVQHVLAMRAGGPQVRHREYPLSGRMTSPCGKVYVGVTRNDHGTSQYKCKGLKWYPFPDWQACGCTRLRAEVIEDAVWAKLTELMSSPERLRALTDDYLGVSAADGQEDELAAVEAKAATLRQRITTQMAAFIKAGVDADQVAGAVAQVEDEIAALDRRAADIRRAMEDGEAAQQQLSAAEDLAARVGGRMDSMTTEQRREVLALLDARAVVLDNSKTPRIRVTVTVRDIELGNPDRAESTSVAPYIPASFELEAA